MYAPIDKSKDHKSGAAANTVAQNQSVGKQGIRFIDQRPELTAQRRLQSIINKKTIQQMSDGTDFDRKRLGAKAEEKTALKQWKEGEFYAWDRTNERKDHHHAHVFNDIDAQTDSVEVNGHVVTAKGVGQDSAKRNLTKFTINGLKGKGDSWTVSSKDTDERLELPRGSKEVPKEKHEEELLLIKGNLENAVYYLLNTPDEELNVVDRNADKIENKIAKKLIKKQALKRQKAQEEASSSDDDLYVPW